MVMDVGVKANGRRSRRTWGGLGSVLLTAVWALVLAVAAPAQVPMPTAREMSGTPLPVGDLPEGTVSVRVVRGDLSNNVVGQPVELRHGDAVLRVRTDDQGRAVFSGLTPAALVQAVTTVDGERLESQRFPVPDRGGVRLMLVAGAAEAPEGVEPADSAAPQPGTVAFGAQSRFVIELLDEAVDVFYLLEIVNPSGGPVTPPAPLALEMPARARQVTLLQGSTPSARVAGSRVTVDGPFEPGRTVLQTAYRLPYSGSRLELRQPIPVPLEQLAVVVQKTEGLRFASPQAATQQEMTADGQTYIVAGGPRVPAGGVISLALEGLPHYNPWPRNVAIALALLIAGAGAWAAASAQGRNQPETRRRWLQSRRDRLFDDLVRLEDRRRKGRMDERRYVARRRELIAELERVYAELDQDVAA